MTEKTRAIEKLLQLNQHKIKLGLGRVNQAIKKLNLNTNFPTSNICTVNGTSAKNSIIQIFKNILIKHKKRYAATYSPHLISVTERFEHNKKFININLLKKILIKTSKQKNLTQFEKLTIAFGLFIKDLKLDWIIGEFGLLGRLDAIRALFPKPNIHIITPISWDHLNWTKTKKMNLKTLKEIVYEKTSFLKCKVYISKQTPTVLKIIKLNLKNNKNKKIIYGKDFNLIKKNRRYFYKDYKNFFEIKSNLIGDHMYENITVAIKVALDQKIPTRIIKSGIRNINIPGRMQVIKKGMLRKGLKKNDILILDGAHNNQQSTQVSKVVSKIKSKNKFCIISMINTKDPSSFLMPFRNKFKKIYFINMERQKNVFPKEKLKEIADKLRINSSIADSFNQVKTELSDTKSRCFVVTGSLYFVGNLLSKN